MKPEKQANGANGANAQQIVAIEPAVSPGFPSRLGNSQKEALRLRKNAGFRIIPSIKDRLVSYARAEGITPADALERLILSLPDPSALDPTRTRRCPGCHVSVRLVTVLARRRGWCEICRPDKVPEPTPSPA